MSRHSNSMACSLFLITFMAHLSPYASNSEAVQPNDISVERIWNKAPHNAFTDLIRWRDRFYCTFREGEQHVFGADGKVRVIASDDGLDWHSVALISEDGVDLRDPKLSITPDDRLMVLMGGSYYDDKELTHRLSRVAFIEAGQEQEVISVPVHIDERIATDNDWLWRVTWHDGTAYGTLYQAYYPPGAKPGYKTTEERPWGCHLITSKDGIHYDLLETFQLGMAGEPTVLFLDDDRMLIITRNGKTADLGISSPPYCDWNWKNLAIQLGGPDLIRLPDGTVVLGTRSYEGPSGNIRHTVFGTLTLEGEFTEHVRVPSGSDTSYPGMVIHQNMLWASYYSNHEGQTSIYLAKIPLRYFQKPHIR